MKIQVLSSLGFKNVGIHLRVAPFESDTGIVNLHPSKGTHWVCYIDKTFFGSYGVVCPEKLSKITIKRNGHCLYSEYKIQGLTSERDSFCARYCLKKIYLKKLIGIDFKSAVLKLYYQMIK